MEGVHWYWGRPSPEDAWRDLRAITEKVRPDWDITRAELREKWQRGERELFFPYRRGQREAA
jgi:hypothetical protein